MISFHAGYLWGKPGMRAFGLIGLFLVGSLLIGAGVQHSPTMLDWIRYRMPFAYVQEGFLLVRFTAGLFAALHAAMVHVPAMLRYRAYVVGDGVGKATFMVSRMFAEGILLLCVYLVFCAAYVIIGDLCSIRFRLDGEMIERIAWGGLFLVQIAALSSVLTFAMKSFLGTLPVLAALAFTIELRHVSMFQNEEVIAWVYRLVICEVIDQNGSIVIYDHVFGLATFVVSALGLVMLYCLSDGELT